MSTNQSTVTMSCPWLAPRFPPGYHYAFPWLQVFFPASSVKVVSFLIAFALSPVNTALPDQKALPVVFEESAANSCTWEKVGGGAHGHPEAELCSKPDGGPGWGRCGSSPQQVSARQGPPSLIPSYTPWAHPTVGMPL